MMFPFDGGFGVFFLVSAILSVAVTVGFIVLIVLGIRWLIRSADSKADRLSPPDEDTALAVLRQRYARGEIDAAEFEERKRTLGA